VNFEPHLFTSIKEIEQIKKYLQKYDWYAEAYINIKNTVDTFLRKGFNVPKESGYVFFETCPRDNTELVFDPYRPDAYCCPVCGMNYKDKPYKRSWILRYHCWLSQMSVLVGIVYLIDGNEAYANAIRKMLLDYAKYYDDYPNNDNELGPTKTFQSTYMESIWIMYLAEAYDMVRRSSCFTADDHRVIMNYLFRPSVDIILDYDEKMNNRQAFNNAGILAVGFLLEEPKLIDYALYGPHGFEVHMEKSVLEDGLWYEGDNYHFATLTSIVNIAEMCRHNDIDMYSKDFNGHTIKMMFDAPLLSLQPDLTFPSRKDSRYASHIAQRWYANLYELAYSRYLDPMYAKILKIVYSYKEHGNAEKQNAAGVIDIFPSEVSRRNRLDWRGFLNATPELGDEEGLPVTYSVNMKGTGLAVLRRNDKGVYVSLDYGNYGGGHGHPDRLNLNLFINGRRWLSDWGTGNYYLDHLKWYRSTIAHNTIGVDGYTQLPVDGECIIFEEKPEVSIVSAQVKEIAPGVDMKRTIILFANGLLFDCAGVESEEKHKYHYALHSFGDLIINNNESKLEPANFEGENYSFIKEIYGFSTDNDCHLEFRVKEASLNIYSIGCKNTSFFKGKAYGPPTRIPELFPVLVIERNEKSTDFVNLMEEVEERNKPLVSKFNRVSDNVYQIECYDGFKYLIQKEHRRWTIDFYQCNNFIKRYAFVQADKNVDNNNNMDSRGKDEFVLNDNKSNNKNNNQNIRSESVIKALHTLQKPTVTIKTVKDTKPLDSFEWEPNIILNKKEQVRRAEKHWQGCDDLSAEAMICRNDTGIILKVRVRDDNVLFSGGKYYFDNDSIQVYFDRRKDKYRTMAKATPGLYGFTVIPGTYDNSSTIKAVWSETENIGKIAVSTCLIEDGYEILMHIPWSSIGGKPEKGEIWGFDIIINDRDSGVRRDLQMVWSGCYEGERIYLREQYHDPKRFGLLIL